VADYAPTQVLAEVFREHGFAGVGYRSSLGQGHNLVLFELDAAEIVKCSLREILDLKLECGRARPDLEYHVESASDVVIAPPEPGTA
jgi:hypothetical protein